jgi:hypothetical protein
VEVPSVVVSVVEVSEPHAPAALTRRYTPDTDCTEGAHGSVVVKALCYKPGGRGFETR